MSKADTSSIALHPLRYRGRAYTAIVDDQSIGIVRLDSVVYSGWIAYRPGEKTALLGDDGYAREFDTPQAAAEALR